MLAGNVEDFKGYFLGRTLAQGCIKLAFFVMIDELEAALEWTVRPRDIAT